MGTVRNNTFYPGNGGILQLIAMERKKAAPTNADQETINRHEINGGTLHYGVISAKATSRDPGAHFRIGVYPPGNVSFNVTP
jgi:hypothetical protein